MILIQRYLLKNLFMSGMAVTAILVGAVWITQILRYLEIILTKTDAQTLTTLLQFALYMAPNLFVLLAPIALAIGCIFTFQKLLEDKEITALWASGVSTSAIIKVVRRLGFWAFLTCLALQAYVAPLFVQKFRHLEQTTKQSFSLSFLETGVFQEFKTVTLFVKEKNDDQLVNILAYVQEPGTQPFTLIAQRGMIFKHQGIPQIVLENGVRHEKLPRHPNKVSTLSFERAIVEIAPAAADTQPHQKKATEYFLWDLIVSQLFPGLSPHLSHEAPPPPATATQEIHLRLLSSSLAYVLPLLVSYFLLAQRFQRRGHRLRLVLATTAVLGVQAMVLLAANAGHSVLIYGIYALLGVCVVTLLYRTSNYRYMKTLRTRMNHDT